MTRFADFVETTGPSPAVSGRSSAGGSVSTTWIVTPPRWKNAEDRAARLRHRERGRNRSGGIATASGHRRRLRRRASASANYGVSGHSIGSARSSASSSHGLPQSFERPRGARFDGAARDVEHRGGLLLRQLEQVAAGEHLARLARNLSSAASRRARSSASSVASSGEGAASPEEVLAASAWSARCSAPAGGAPAVASLVRDDLQKPGAHRLAGAETGRAHATP